jgi:hypothetical protein
MKRSMVLLLSCLALAGSAWLARVVWAQSSATKEKTVTITQSQFDAYVAKKIADAAAATDDQVHNPQNWHIAVVEHAQYVVYTGPGTPMFHHWVQPAAKPPAAKSGAAKGGAATTPPSNGN